MYEVKKTTLGIKLIPGDGGFNEEMHIEGHIDDLLCAYVSLSKHLFDTIANDTDTDFAAHVYAQAQELIIQESCIKSVVNVVKVDRDDVEKRFGPLMKILGKTFTMPGKEGVAE